MVHHSLLSSTSNSLSIPTPTLSSVFVFFSLSSRHLTLPLLFGQDQSCSLKNSSWLHTSCQPINAVAAQEAQSSASGDRQALISLSDKNNLAFLGNELQNLGYKIVSTGGNCYSLLGSSILTTPELKKN
ncbi:putative methylglyoxal synthase-like domain-containing protein [Rosa chinensis]|uniref:Putative methylglyoxal synthase-like domain-containing protein n=1 Tax=Rosa chinensis TaxID=74649 RepID=A0A2P6R8P3_ROSCH|nr:putative methylglyoxal synthase-like domain-containing protein [Rosa chinensis]PRQ42784.1 putative methylglyoxal synthase-like domain-containing protein [Rosa chinensis]